MPPAAAARPDEIAFNRASVALARSQALIASWLPPRTTEEAASAKSDDDVQKEDKALFTPSAEVLGVGAEPPKDVLEGSFRRNQLSSNERLRQQLLGKNAKPGPKSAQQSGPLHAPVKKPAPKPAARRQADSDDDEEEGRAAAFKSKRQKTQAATTDPIANARRPREEDASDSDEREERPKAALKQAPAPATSSVPERPKKKANSFLDELLEERSKKKKKKRNKNKGEAAGQE
ncbi:uncharacterized protein K452DRAFT_316207 [Aplosporella prunicola CBS 121167]|uniref:Uncharacterized protein n=1 Tax=Aplosporella prunicola CBS 121167 TaxID=1176127 RepID=A0A6A6BPD3_9PEZI|nr:uncharacterized protein K452DRAFT_316207 [Aplosporella prunicola CBS 121167]KAF2145084.1 hypothetical protein K452DRAFT_316207 [Aplosporella prunicola CBS 121167]